MCLVSLANGRFYVLCVSSPGNALILAVANICIWAQRQWGRPRNTFAFAFSLCIVATQPRLYLWNGREIARKSTLFEFTQPSTTLCNHFAKWFAGAHASFFPRNAGSSWFVCHVLYDAYVQADANREKVAQVSWKRTNWRRDWRTEEEATKLKNNAKKKARQTKNKNHKCMNMIFFLRIES